MNTSIREQLLQNINNKTKPLGALGMLETVALQMGIIQNSLSPQITHPHIVVFAADHGIAATGLVNPYPQAVTAQMVLNFVNGGAAINVFCRQHHIALQVVDAGVNVEFDKTLPIIHAKIKMGTADYSTGNAMTEEEVQAAIDTGKKIVQEIFDKGCNTIGFGEMGIGNTSAAALIMSAIINEPIENCVGRGTGSNDEQLKIKKEVLKNVFIKHQLGSLSTQPLALLRAVGGAEIAMMTGAYVQAAACGMGIVVDGFIATAALLTALQLDASILLYCIFAHTSNEQGHTTMLNYLKAQPLLHLGLRLGEGTGAALAIPLLQSAVNFLNEMASFENAGVSEK